MTRSEFDRLTEETARSQGKQRWELLLLRQIRNEELSLCWVGRDEEQEFYLALLNDGRLVSLVISAVGDRYEERLRIMPAKDMTEYLGYW